MGILYAGWSMRDNKGPNSVPDPFMHFTPPLYLHTLAIKQLG